MDIDNDNYQCQDQEHDDEYYLARGLIPPKFRRYKQIRMEKWVAAGNKPWDSCYDRTITQEELDFYLKRELRKAPEERYQAEKANRFFHDLSCYMRGLSIDDYDKGCHDEQCIPECRFYLEYGRIEDAEVIDEHNKRMESLRQETG